MPPKISPALNIQEEKALARMIDTDVEEGLHPMLLEDIEFDDDTVSAGTDCF